MKILAAFLVLLILIFIGMFYYRSCKKTADEFIRTYIEGRDEIEKKGDEP